MKILFEKFEVLKDTRNIIGKKNSICFLGDILKYQ